MPPTDGRARLLLVVGKGGVGRSTVAAALARRAGRRGERVLAVDATSAGGLALALGVDGPPGVMVDVGVPAPGVTLLELDTEAALEEYVRLNLRFPIPTRHLGPIARIFEFVATAAPAVREILTIGKIGHEVRRGPWDLVVVDTPASGHVIELLAAPDALGELIGIGPLAAETAWLSALMADGTATSAVVVTLAEELPVNETLQLVERLGARTGVRVGGVVVNRRAPAIDPAGLREASELDPTAPAGLLAATVVARAAAEGEQRARLAPFHPRIVDVEDDPDDPVGAVERALDHGGWEPAAAEAGS
ncbi:MAG: ArsA family ATPase [Acidimicrobiales bacterium]